MGGRKPGARAGGCGDIEPAVCQARATATTDLISQSVTVFVVGSTHPGAADVIYPSEGAPLPIRADVQAQRRSRESIGVGSPERLVGRAPSTWTAGTPAGQVSPGRPRPRLDERCSAPSSPMPTTNRRPSKRSRATAVAHSSRRRCGRTSSRRCSTATPAPGDRRRRRRPGRARTRGGAPGVARPADRPLLPEPRRHLRVASGAAAAPGRPADRGARRADRRARRGGEAPVVVVSAVALSEKVPDPALRPHGFTLRAGELLDLEETARDLVAAGYERVDQVEDRGQFAIRGGLLDLFPATEDRAVRVDLFGDEIESLRWFSTFTQRSLGDAELVEVAPAAELAEEHRELAEIAALEDEADRPDITELLPVENFHPFLELAPADAEILIAGEEDVTPALARPLAGRVRGVPRPGCPPPVRRPGDDRLRAVRARADPPVEHRPGPAVLVPRAGRRRPGPRDQGGRARAREAGPLALPRGGRVRAQGGRASGSRTTSAGSTSAGSTEAPMAAGGRDARPDHARARRGSRPGSSRRSSTSR